MKKITQRFLSLLMLLAVCSIGWASEVTLHDGTTTSQYVPMYVYYFDDFTRSQYVIPSSKLTAVAGESITAITYYTTSQNVPYTTVSSVDIYLKEVADEIISSFEDKSTSTTVYQGTVEFVSQDGGGVATIEFTTPFQYNGGNLMIGCDNTTDAGYKNIYFYGETVNGASIAGYNSSDLAQVTAAQRNFLPKVTITYGAPPTCPKPTALAVSGITHEEATLSWNSDASAFDICLNGDEDHLISVSENPYTLTGLSTLTSYNVKVRANCGADGNSEWSSVVNFSTTAQATPVGDAWSDDFEGELGWELINGDRTNAWAWGTAVSNGGTHSLYISDDGGTSNNYSGTYTKVLAAKLLSFETGKYTFSFDWKCKGESSCDFLRVALVPASQTLVAGSDYSSLGTTSLPTGWIALDGESKLNLNEEWQNKSISINVTAGNYYVVLGWRDDTSVSYNPPAAVDNFSIVKFACPYDVEGLAVDAESISTSEATISWTENEDVTQWQVAYSLDNSFPEASTQLEIVSGSSIDLQSLQSSSVYYVKARACCGSSDFGSWSSAISFTTDCEAIIIDADHQYSENFDALTAGDKVLPICWNHINTTSSTTYDKYPKVYANSSYSIYAQSAPNCLYLYSNYSSYYSYDPQPQYAILPQMNDLDGKQITLSARGYNSNSVIQIGRMSDPVDASTFVSFATQALTTSYQEFEYIIPSGDGNYLAIMIEAATSSRTTNGAYVDDIVVSVAPSCPKPSALMLETPSSRTAHTAKLKWFAQESQNAWEIAYSKLSNFNPDEQVSDSIASANSNPFVLSGLEQSTTYYAFVRANCGSEDGKSAWSTSKATFATVSGHQSLNSPALVEGSLGSQSAKVNWKPKADNELHESYDIYYSKLSTIPAELSEDGLIPHIADTFYVFDNLEPETQYYVWVRDNCGEDGLSDWSSPATFTTTAMCPIPAGVRASEIAARTADIAWTIGEADSYIVQYRIAEGFNSMEEETFASSSIPSGWENKAGLLSNVLNGTALSSGSTWKIGTQNGVFDSHVRINIYGSSCNGWLISPSVTISEGATLNFDLALTHYSGTLAAPSTTGTDDRFVVLISTDNKATWTILREWNNSGSTDVYNSIPVSGVNVNIDLASYNGQSVQIAFYGESTSSNADNNLHIDNVQIGEPIPAGTWAYVETESDERLAHLSGLEPETTYEVRVRASCAQDPENDFSEPVFFTTAEACPIPTALEASNIAVHSADLAWNGSVDVASYDIRYRTAEGLNVVFSEGFEDESSYSNWLAYGVVDNNTGDRFGRRTDAKHNGYYGFSFSSFSQSSDYNQYLVSPELSVSGNLEFDYRASSSSYPETFKVGYSTSGNDVNTDFTWSGEITTSSLTWLHFGPLSLPDSVKYVAIHYYSNYKFELYIDDITIGEPIAAGAWQEASSNETSLSLENLAADTKYDVQVKSVCSGEEWTEVNFTTLNNTLSINESGYATYFNADDAYIMPEGLTGYVFSTANSPKLAEEYAEGEIVPAATPLVINGPEGNYILASAAGGNAPAHTNDLIGVNEETLIADDADYYFYVLSLNAASEPESVGFYWMNETGAGGFRMLAHKAYLKLARESASGAPAAFFLFNEDKNATWLDNLRGVDGAVKFWHNGNFYIMRDHVIYDATGRKVRELE